MEIIKKTTWGRLRYYYKSHIKKEKGGDIYKPEKACPGEL